SRFRAVPAAADVYFGAVDLAAARAAEALKPMKYSLFNLLRQAASGHAHWPAQGPRPDPKPAYDVVIVGAGGHGLATAYYLAKEHRISKVAVLEKGWIGGGNTRRTTPPIQI